ncbi:MAG: hemolysin D [Gallionellales bacterium RBG_16_56_9]|nr:MAG: hemolysin D [Gallionellales bacterium RBG_16_56_9]
MKKLLGNKEAVTDVVYHEVAAPEVNTDAGAHTRLGWWIVIAGVGGFFLWASLAPLDQGVPVSGTVTVATNKKAIQHPTGGVVEEILVREGDAVKAGQPLVKMNDIQVRAQADIARVQYFAARATEARLIAERDGKKSIAFPPELESERDNPRIASDIRTQKQLFDSRRTAIQGELAILEEQLAGVRDLAKEGYVARNRLLDLERTYIQRNQGYQSEVRTQLAEVQKEAEALKMRLISLDFDLANAIVKAPTDGTVVGMNVFTNGGVIGSGFRMMDIVPSEDKLIVEGQVPVNLIDKVYPDLEVELIFSAFNQNLTPHIPGVVTFVSADRMVDERSGAPYYKMKAVVTPEGMKLIENLQVRPGMPVDLFIKTGERTMMNYLMKPLTDNFKAALSE